MCLLSFQISGCNEKNDKNEPIDGSKIGYQLEMPNKGEEIAEVTTNLGTFKIRFFPEEAPKAVENFKTLSKNGYYNGITFHRVIKDFMIQGGDPDGNGTGGESMWGKDFEDEFSPYLLNITGALSMANRGPNTNGSQFFINCQDPSEFIGWNNLKRSIDMSKVTEELKTLYEQNGGNPNLDGYYSLTGSGHTVFGQVFEGMDTIRKISYVDVDNNDKPIESVIIDNIDIKENT